MPDRFTSKGRLTKEAGGSRHTFIRGGSGHLSIVSRIRGILTGGVVKTLVADSCARTVILNDADADRGRPVGRPSLGR